MVDFSHPGNWTLSRSCTSFKCVGGGYVGVIFQSKIPKVNKWGAFIKQDKPDNYDELPIEGLFFSDSLRELMLQLEVIRLRQYEQALEQSNKNHLSDK